jgi:hypothetical protein
LALLVPVIGRDRPPATQALTTSGLAAHRDHKPEENGHGLNQSDGPEENENRRKKKGLERNSGKKTPPKRINFSTARFLYYETARHSMRQHFSTDGVGKCRQRGPG